VSVLISRLSHFTLKKGRKKHIEKGTFRQIKPKTEIKQGKLDGLLSWKRANVC
jgi:hypothetical protein